MRIVIDLQPCQSDSRFRGIGRYSMALAKAMVQQGSKHEFWLVLNDRFPDTIPSIRREFADLIPKERIAIFSIHGPVAERKTYNSWRVHEAEILREYYISLLKPDIVHVASLFEGFAEDVVSSVGVFDANLQTAVTLYDLIPLAHQDIYLPDKLAKNFYFRKIVSIKRANILFAISEYSRNEAISLLGIEGEKVINISTAIDEKFRVLDIEDAEKKVLFNHYKITKPFIMYSPGGFDPRKNIKGLIIAYAHLPSSIRNNYQLVITGRVADEPYRGIIEHMKSVGVIKDELIFTNYIDDADLIQLYNTCDLFVFPSLYEGFGLPALEAMACGAVVIGSNATSIPEVIGRADALFDPTSSQSIADSIVRGLTDKKFRQSFREHARLQVKNFSWQSSANKVIDALESLYTEKASMANVKMAFNSNGYYQKLLSSLANIDTVERPTEYDLLEVAKSVAWNQIEENHRLFVDISVLVHGDAKSGIQRVVRSILVELLKSPPSGYTVKPIYFDDYHYCYANQFLSRFLEEQEELSHDYLVDMQQGDIYLGLDLSAHLAVANHNLFKRLNALGVELYFVVYDIIFAHHPEWWPMENSKMLLDWLKSITEIGTGLVCISQSVAQEVDAWMKINPPIRIEPLSIKYFHLGADIENSVPTKGIPDDATHVLETLRAVPSFLMVGTVEPRKGHAQVLSAFEILWENGFDINLVIVGSRGWLMEKFERILRGHSEFGRHLFWLESISDEYLEQVYVASTCLIVASEAEGFGLPLIEAAQKKLPIIARDIPVFQEVAGEHAFYFQGFEPEKLAEVIKEWINLQKQNLAPPSEKIPWLTWAESAKYLMNNVIGDGQRAADVKTRKK